MTLSALEVDCTGFIVAALAGVIEPVSGHTARIVTEKPGKIETVVLTTPVIQVFRIGGPDDGRVLDIPTIVLHSFTPYPPDGRKTAERLLLAAKTLLRSRIGTVQSIDGGNAVLTSLRVLSGPLWAPDDNPAVRHAVLTIQPRIKITR